MKAILTGGFLILGACGGAPFSVESVDPTVPTPTAASAASSAPAPAMSAAPSASAAVPDSGPAPIGTALVPAPTSSSTPPPAPVPDAGAGAAWAASPCSLLPSDTYCPGSASVWGPPDAAVLVPYWCSAGFSPGPSCAFVDGSGADGGAGQWCCQ